MKKEQRLQSERTRITVFKKIILAVVSISLILIQFALFYFVYIKAYNNSWVYIFVQILSAICVISIFDRKMSSSYKLVWTILILIFPLVCSVLYLIYGNERSFPTHKSKKIHRAMDKYIMETDQFERLRKEDPIAFKHTNVTNHGCGLPAYTNTTTKFYNDINEKHHDLVEDIKKAEKYIFIEYFIFASGQLLNSLMDALEDRGKAGVEIKICYDDFGSKLVLKKKDYNRIRAIPNLTIIKFAPLGQTFNMSINYRNHRKCVIIDGKIAYVGGDNISDEYANLKTRFGVWRDNALRIEGEAVNNCLFTFAETWYMSTKIALDLEKYQVEYKIENTNNLVMPFGDGPTDRRNPAYDLYTSIADNSQKYLYISTPYFVIDPEFIEQICNACRSGIDVRIMVPGIPDKKTVYYLTQSHFGEILRCGGKIYKYSKGFNHAKNFICDDKYAVIGTVNLDYRSLYLHFENAIYFAHDQEIIKMREDFEETLKDCELITYEKWKKRPLWLKIAQFILKLFSPLM